MSLRDLAWMLDGKLSITWQQTAWLTAATLNTQFGRSKSVQPNDCNPYYQAQQPAEDEENLLDGLLGLS